MKNANVISRLAAASVICATLLLTLTSPVWASEEPLYPPEYADFFEQFRVITPEEVMLDAALYGDDPGHTLAGGIVLEPIFIKCANGVPAYYLVLSYNGEDAGIRGKMEEVISMLNDEAGFDPYELDEKITALEPYWGDFYTFGTPAWTFGGAPCYSTTYAPQLFVWFHTILTKLAGRYRRDEMREFKAYATHIAISVPLFGFKNGDGETIYFIYKPNGEQLLETDESELSTLFVEDTEILLNSFSANAEGFFEKRAYWDGIKGHSGEVEKEGKYLKVREHNPGLEGAVDGFGLEDVPDFNLNTAPPDHYSGDCWVWSMVSPLVFQSQRAGGGARLPRPDKGAVSLRRPRGCEGRGSPPASAGFLL